MGGRALGSSSGGRAGGASIQAVLGGWREPYQGAGLAFKSPTQRSDLGAGGRGWRCPWGPGLGGSHAWVREAPPFPSPSPEAHPAQSFPSRSQRHGTEWHRVKLRAVSLPSTSPPGSGLAVALVDVIFHQGYHLLELVLQLGPPSSGVCLQGSHDLRGEQGAAGSQPEAPTVEGGDHHAAWISTAANWPPTAQMSWGADT